MKTIYIYCEGPTEESFINTVLYLSLIHIQMCIRDSKRPLCEIAETIKIVRENSERWQIDAHKIAVCGFSAGGHLAASLAVHWNDPENLKRCHVQDA